ncbi:type II secretion system F family protein [Thiohalomonas denitrificans]|uniref:Tight adherence protein C n=1 Tax=Thiohalomonas denitrificans TaxID=415747 RepID=A0A1G5QES8_9GAMM|nr:type II secretion system F family protein [Thiohalomonas denitrificans]SCZ60172.1 tight adherence protein C [Thiohalomonas denitrificans]
MDYFVALLSRLSGSPEAVSVVFSIVMGVAAFSFGVAGLLLVNGLNSPTRQRLQRLTEDSSIGRKGVAARFMERLTPYYHRIIPKDHREQAHVKRQLVQAGFRRPNALGSFFALKIMLTVGLPMLVFFVAAWIPGLAMQQVLFAAVTGGGVGLFGPNYVLHKKVTARQRRLMEGLPDALDLLVVCAEAGLGLKGAIQRVADDLGVSHPELAGELSLVNVEVRAGVSHTDALRNLAERTGLEELRGLVTLLVQSMRFGTSIADALRIFATEFRDRRMQKAEEAAAKIGTKMIFPLVLCLFPSFFLVAIGPAILGVLAAFR